MPDADSTRTLSRSFLAWTVLSIIVGNGTIALKAQATLEYVAHACFVIEAPTGERVIIDPYNGSRWLEYGFPSGVRADGVLITHPHYDHDASYYFEGRIPVLRQPGNYQIPGFRLQGIEGKHADPYGGDFGQFNTIWVVETGGVRIAHLGDNGALNDQVVRQMGRIDVLLAPIDGTYHILKKGEIDTAIRLIRPRFLVPMHYRIPSINPDMEDLGPVDPWVADRTRVRRLDQNQFEFSRGPAADNGPEILIFSPSEAVRHWPESLRKAWQALRLARKLQASDAPASLPEAIAKLRESHELAPHVLIFSYWLAQGLKQGGQNAEALAILERGLSHVTEPDWEYLMRSRLLAGELLLAAGKSDQAAAQARAVLRNSFRSGLINQARALLAQAQN